MLGKVPDVYRVCSDARGWKEGKKEGGVGWRIKSVVWGTGNTHRHGMGYAEALQLAVV